MTTHWRFHRLVDAIETANVIAMVVGQQNGPDFGSPKLLIQLQNALSPILLLFPCVNQNHLFMRIANKVIVATARMVNRVIVNVHDVNMGLHFHGIAPLLCRFEHGQ